eukprot:m.176745 g.176745  ORF g.176745 m.176745 type:complete len:743 (+) comp17952_c1_seq1:173-2401(+)
MASPPATPTSLGSPDDSSPAMGTDDLGARRQSTGLFSWRRNTMASSSAASATADKGSKETEQSWLYMTDFESPCCLRCGRRFALTVKKHRCYCCGVAVCGPCSSERLKYQPKLRVCSDCYRVNQDQYKVQASLRPAPVTIHSGFLYKQGQKVKSWRRRFCLLDSNGVLSYFKGDAGGEDKIAGIIPVGSCTQLLEGADCKCSWPSSADETFAFGVVTPYRTYYLYTDDEDSYMQWTGIIRICAGLCAACLTNAFAQDTAHVAGAEKETCIYVPMAGKLYHESCFKCPSCAARFHVEPCVLEGMLQCQKHAPKDEEPILAEFSRVNREEASKLIKKDIQELIEIELQASAPTDVIDVFEDPDADDGEGGDEEGDGEPAALVPWFDVVKFAVYGVHRAAGMRLAPPASDGDEVSAAAGEGDDDMETVQSTIKLQDEPFDFVTFHPEKFARLRTVCGITEEDYAKSFAETPGLDKAIGGGRSGSFVIASQDSRYIIKSMSAAEQTLLCSILVEYSEHISANPGSLLTRYLGVYSVCRPAQKTPIIFVIMDNILSKAGDLEIHEVYDLKGSYVDRRSITKKKASNIDPNEYRGTRKDMDLRRPLSVGERGKAILQAQMASDVTFLNSLNLMDYSLLAGIHNCLPDQSCCTERLTEEQERQAASGGKIRASSIYWHGIRGGGPRGEPNGSVYFFGIIDLLQTWDRSKVAESFLKSKLLGKDKHGISAINSDDYAERFLDNLTVRFES